MQRALPKHNQQYAPFFDVSKKRFLDSSDELVEKQLFYCSDLKGMLKEVLEKRGIEEETENLVQGDTGQDWLKIGLNIIRKRHLEKDDRERLPGAGVEFAAGAEEGLPPKRARRSMADGVQGIKEFKDWGSRRMILLAVVNKVPESHFNIDLIFKSINIESISFKLTGDFAFLMPILGLIKGCGGTNPCPLCTQQKTTRGGQGSRWIERPEDCLRTMESLFTNYAGWVMSGEKMSASMTKMWDGVCCTPLLPFHHGAETRVLDILVPGPLHLFLSLNEVINFLERTQWPELKQVIQDHLGVKFHVYMGKVGNYEGPCLNKILNNLEKLRPFMLDANLLSFYEAFVAFKAVAKAVFTSNQLACNWRESLHTLKSRLLTLHHGFGMSITPKLHVLIVHVEQWVDIFGRPLGMEGEQAGEAVHHIWKRLLGNLGLPKVKESSAFVDVVFKALLMFNANNTA